VVLKTIAPGGGAYRLTPVGDRLAFVVEEWETHPDGSMDLHEDLWVTDGTPEGTTRFAQFKNIGNHGMSPLTVVGSTLYFMINNGGSAIWKSDLTAPGTAPVITVGGVAKNFTAFGTLITFSGGPASQLWATDGTAAGTRRLSNIGALIQPPHPDWMTTVGDTVYFISSGRYNSGEWYAGYGEELWKTDGTPDGTVRLFSGQVHDLIDFNGTLYFAGSRPRGGYELWKSDGTAAGTVRVKDVQPDNARTNLRLLSVVNGRLFFGVNSGFAYQDSDFQLWGTNGTDAGTAKVTDAPMFVDITSMAPNAMHVFAGAGNYFYFRRHDGGDILNDQLWRTDGTAAGTTRVGVATDPRNLIDLNGTLYYTATNPGGFTGETLYRLQPGASQPAVVRTFDFGDYRLVSALTKVGANLFLSAPRRRCCAPCPARRPSPRRHGSCTSPTSTAPPTSS
jgi:ELWxxDGT repeat protein